MSKYISRFGKSILVLCVVCVASSASAQTTGAGEGTTTLTPGSSEDTVFLQAVDADLVDLLRMLAQDTAVNLMIDPGVAGRVTVDFNDVDRQEAIDAILLSNGYVARRHGRILRITKAEPEQLAIASRQFELHSVAAGELKEQIEQLLTEKGKLVINPFGNSFVVHDREEVIERVQEIVKTFDVRERQVMIKARLLEVSLDKRDELGFEWSWLDSSLRIGRTSGTVIQQLLPDSDAFEATLGNRHFDSIARALITEGHMNLLSAPTITTVNNREARVEITEDIPYVKATTTIDTGGGTTTATETVEFVSVGVKLTVTPQIGSDNFVRMTIVPEVSEAPTRFNGIPVVKTRTAETTLIVEHGQTIALGGLIRENATETVRRVPIISSIPIIGALFRSTDKTLTKVELIIFITPYIIDDELATLEAQEGEQRMKDKAEAFRRQGSWFRENLP